MNKIQIINNWGKDKLFVFLCTLMALYPASPLILDYVSRDSGVFLFAGWRILNGEIPYVDFWDHKPPIVFFINAIGIGLYNGSRWGVWVVEFISLWIAGYLGFRLMKNMFGTFASSIATFMWMYSLVFLISGGNYTSEYVLPFQMATLFLFYKAQENGDNSKLFFVIGLFGSLSFFTKQTTIGIWLAIILYLVIIGVIKKEIINAFKKIFYILLGGLMVTIIICGYFYINDALFAFWDSAFYYNFVYSIGNEILMSTRIKNFFNFGFVSKLGLIHFSLLGMIFFIFLSLKKNLGLTNSQKSILQLVLINFPIELILINLTGNPYDHYFTTILPALALSSGFIFFLFDSKILQSDANPKQRKFLLLIAIISVFALNGLVDYHNKRIAILKTKINEPVIEFIRENTESSDGILIWGAETMVNYHTQRKSPTQYVYQYPLIRESNTSEEKILEFLDDIIQNKPKFIMDSEREDMPFFVFPIHSQRIDEKLNQIWATYVEVDEINSWKVYQLSLDKTVD